MKIGHAHIKVRNLERSTAFYEQFLGLSVRERIEGHFVFMSATEVHHEIALQQVGMGARTPGRFEVGLFHVAFEAPDKPSLARCYKKLMEHGIPVVAVDHRISWAIYFSDPDGNGLEIYCDTRGEPDGGELWDGMDRPLAAGQLLALAEGG